MHMVVICGWTGVSTRLKHFSVDSKRNIISQCGQGCYLNALQSTHTVKSDIKDSNESTGLDGGDIWYHACGWSTLIC